jgi:hypothetical protein
MGFAKDSTCMTTLQNPKNIHDVIYLILHQMSMRPIMIVMCFSLQLFVFFAIFNQSMFNDYKFPIVGEGINMHWRYVSCNSMGAIEGFIS